MIDVEVVELTPDDPAWPAALDVLSELRDKISADELAARVEAARNEGYRMIAAIRNGVPVAVAGFRVINNTSAGKHLYVDDLVTLAMERSQGHGSILLERLRAEATAAGCDQLHLDSGTQRIDAHRFYEREGLTIRNYHFIEDLEMAGGNR